MGMSALCQLCVFLLPPVFPYFSSITFEFWGFRSLFQR